MSAEKCLSDPKFHTQRVKLILDASFFSYYVMNRSQRYVSGMQFAKLEGVGVREDVEICKVCYRLNCIGVRS